MAENIPRRVIAEVVDLVVYAPVGLAATMLEEMPALVEKGRARLSVARTIGQFAFVMGRQRVEQAISERQNARRAPSPGPGTGTGHADDEALAGDADDAGDPARGGLTLVEDEGAPFDGAGVPSAEASALAIPGYDSLAASQVVQRLAGLSPDELEAVRTYEEATRGRRTILGRIAQLSSTRGEPDEE